MPHDRGNTGKEGKEMFFKLSVFKKLLKDAYKGSGLTVNRTAVPDEYGGVREGIYLQGRHWAMWIDLEAMPKEAKAAVVELCGELPELEKPFTAQENEINQYEIERMEYMNLLERARSAKTKFKVSGMMIKKGASAVRLMQLPETGRIAMIAEIFMDLIDIDSMSAEAGEVIPLGPLAENPDSSLFYWWNYHCSLLAMAKKAPQEGTEEHEYIRRLEQWPII